MYLLYTRFGTSATLVVLVDIIANALLFAAVGSMLVLGVYGIDLLLPFARPERKAALAVSTILVTAIAGAIYGTAKGIEDYWRVRDIRDPEAFLGPGATDVAGRNLRRSADGRRQHRYMASDCSDPVPKSQPHYHLERLDQTGDLVLESCMVPFKWPATGGATRVVGPREYALVHGIAAGHRVRHLVGRPPDLTRGRERRSMLPWPQVLIADQREEGVFLWRFAEDGEYAGDTWHESLEEAKHQADYEYGESLGRWAEIMEQPPDIVKPALAWLR